MALASRETPGLCNYDDQRLQEDEWDELFMRDGFNYLMSTADGVMGGSYTETWAAY